LPAANPRAAWSEEFATFDEAVDSLGMAAGQTAPPDVPESRSPIVQETMEPKSDERQPIVLGAMSKLSLVSFSTMAAGWFWGKRRRERRVGMGRGGGRSR
jgi:hypothetical protein